MILVSLTLWLPRGFANFPKKTNFLIEVFPFRGLLISMGFDYFKAPRSLFAVREGERRIRRSYSKELLEGASKWAGPRKQNGKSQRFSLRFSSLEGLLVYGGEFTLMSSCFDGCRWAEDSRTGPQTRIKKRWKPENPPGASRNLSFTFFVSEASVGVEARG